MKSIQASAIAGVLLVMVSAGVSAQTPDDATNVLRSRLRTGDCVWVEINGIAVQTGRVLAVALGTLVGAGVGFALGLPLAAIGANEGTGTALDAFLWVKHTVYTRHASASSTE